MADQEQTGYERLGGRRLSLVDAVAQSVGFIGPVFSTAFIIPAIIGANAAAKGAGIAAPLAVLVSAVGVFALGWIVAQYAKRIHAAGSLYDYVSNGLGRTIGASAGWLYYGGTIMLTVGLGVLIGGYVHDILLPTLGFDSGWFDIWIWDAIWVVVLFILIYFGVQISTRVQLTLALISMAVVGAFFIKVIVDLGGGNDVATTFNPNSSPDGWSGVFFGVLYGVLIFVGFETAANLAEETAEPKRHIPRAVLLSVLIVSAFYLLGSYATVAGFHFNLDEIFAANSLGPVLFSLSDPSAYGTELIAKVIVIVVLFDIMAVGVGAAVASTRGVFAMARDRRLPSPLASVAPRFGTPAGAIVLLMVIQVVLIVATEASDTFLALPPLPHYFAIFIWCATFGAFALIVVYLLMSIGALRGLADHPNQVGLWVSALVGIVITGAAIFGSFYKVTSPTLLAPWAALIWGVLGLLYMLAVKGREPARVALPELRTHQE
jgi:amino acid transporter